MSRLRYIGYISEAKKTKSFVEDFIERLKFVVDAPEKEMDEIVSETLKKC